MVHLDGMVVVKTLLHASVVVHGAPAMYHQFELPVRKRAAALTPVIHQRHHHRLIKLIRHSIFDVDGALNGVVVAAGSRIVQINCVILLEVYFPFHHHEPIAVSVERTIAFYVVSLHPDDYFPA